MGSPPEDAIPTLVEVKRSSDTRIRREVVGQMLDYAANSVVYWPAGAIRQVFESDCESRNDDPDLLIADLIRTDPDNHNDLENFWDQVKTNQQAGKIRLVFIADEIPKELKCIVEFLNGLMDPAEVLAVEIRQYVGEGLKTLVPKVIGQTAKPLKSERSLPKRKWNSETFFNELELRSGRESTEVARKILSWALENRNGIWWGEGRQDGSFAPEIVHKGVTHYPVGV